MFELKQHLPSELNALLIDILNSCNVSLKKKKKKKIKETQDSLSVSSLKDVGIRCSL